MSAPAPALAKAPRRIVTVRLADAALTVACLSLVFGFLLVFFPVSFARIIQNSWLSGNLTVVMMVITLSIDVCLYVRIAYRLSAKPTVLAATCLGSLPIVVVAGLSFYLQGAVDYTLSGDLPNLEARVGEEILAHTYLGLVSGIFVPFLVIRLLQQLKAASSNRETESPSRSAPSVSSYR
jgi:hypothetical protein